MNCWDSNVKWVLDTEKEEWKCTFVNPAEGGSQPEIKPLPKIVLSFLCRQITSDHGDKELTGPRARECFNWYFGCQLEGFVEVLLRGYPVTATFDVDKAQATYQSINDERQRQFSTANSLKTCIILLLNGYWFTGMEMIEIKKEYERLVSGKRRSLNYDSYEAYLRVGARVNGFIQSFISKPFKVGNGKICAHLFGPRVFNVIVTLLTAQRILSKIEIDPASQAIFRLPFLPAEMYHLILSNVRRDHHRPTKLHMSSNCISDHDNNLYYEDAILFFKEYCNLSRFD